MSFVKYRLKEVAADFGVSPKEISDIISKFYEKPKSNTQILSDNELNAVFDYMTQKNQIASIEQVFAMKATAPTQEAPKAAAPQQQNRPQGQNQQAVRPQGQNQNRPQGQQQGNRPQGQNQNRPQNQTAPKPQQPAPQPEKPKEPERKRERRVVDTSAVQVNANRFADVDNLVSEKVQNFQGGKQRIGGGKGKQQQKQQKNNFKSQQDHYKT